MRGPIQRVNAALLLMTASGFAGLGYQLVWTQQCALWLGHESASVLAVVAALFGGLAVGALLLGTRIGRSAHPVRWYAACESLIAAWAALLLLLMRPVTALALSLIGTQPTPAWHWCVAFAGTFVLLLPATAAMGATLPAMARVMAGLRAQRPGAAIAALYASNTAGAVLGVLVTAFWLVPQWGLERTATLCMLLNLLCAAGALWLFKSAVPVVASKNADATAALAIRPAAGRRAVLLRLAATGLLGIGYEVLVVRVLSQVCEDTVFTFALLLAVYLLGTACGAAAYQRWGRATAAFGERLLAALAAACLMAGACLWGAENIRTHGMQILGDGLLAAIAAEAALAVTVFALPTLVMGALFSHLSVTAERSGVGFARALAANTLGAACAPFVFGVVLAPTLGAKATLLLLALCYLLLISPPAWLRPQTWLPASAAALVAWIAPPLDFVDVPDGGHIVSYREGSLAAVSVVEDAQGISRLRINNRQQEGSSATRFFDARQGVLPLLLHPAPQRALFLGLGTGVTAGAAAEEAGLHVDAVELLPEVIAASAHFTPESRVHMMAADARRYVMAAHQHYDVIVADNFHPARSGSGALYTVEHFRAVRQRLKTSGTQAGLFCQWLPLHQMDIATVRSIVQSFLIAFPGAHAVLATNSLQTPTLGLIGRADDGRFDPQSLRGRSSAAAMQARLQALGLADEFAVLGSFIAGPQALARFAASAPANTDDHPVVTYMAPRLTYSTSDSADGQVGERLLALLHELHVAADEVLIAAPDVAWSGRLTAYWQARDRYLRSGLGVRPTSDAQAMLQQVREPLLAVLRISPDFRPAYDPLLRLGLALAGSHPRDARALLQELASVQPARSEAAAALVEMGSE